MTNRARRREPEYAAPRWLARLLALVLVAVSGYALLGSREQAAIVSQLATESTNTDAYQRAAYLSAAEMALIQAVLREPGGEERARLRTVRQRAQTAMLHMAEVDDEHSAFAAGIARRHRELEPWFTEYLREVDEGNTAAARRILEDTIEPATDSIMTDVLVEQSQHLAGYRARQADGQRHSQRLLWNSALAFAVGVVVLALFGWATRIYRRRLEVMATTDPLTGLPNRSAFVTRTRQELADEGSHRRRSRAGRVTVLAINLDGFREVNEQLGPGVGDLLLRQVGTRLRASVRESDLVARIGGDDFAVLLRDHDPQIGEATAAALTGAFDKPFVIDELTIDLEISAGAATAGPGDTVADVLQHADTAMNIAKQQRLGFRRFITGHGQDSAARLCLLGDLRRALDTDADITLHYQPQIDIGAGVLAGVEALARWHHPDKGLIPPGDFIPVLETTSLIHRFTDRVLDLALAQARAWLDDGYRIPVAINISTRTLLDPGFAGRVADGLRRSGVPGDQLCIEVTEHSVMSDPATAIDALHRIRALGVRTSIDDYGTGYSSMTYLRLLPLDELKIDRAFVEDMARDAGNHALVRSAVELGHNLGLSVVAEGVEDAGTLAALRAMGCDVAQGYHFGAPMSAPELTAGLRSSAARAA